MDGPIDASGDKPLLTRAERHPEKAHRPDNPIPRKPDWIRVRAPNSPEYAETKRLMDSLNESHPKLMEELVPKLLTLGEVGRVLEQLLRERVSIRDLGWCWKLCSRRRARLWEVRRATDCLSNLAVLRKC